jgi:hypothetical protein
VRQLVVQTNTTGVVTVEQVNAGVVVYVDAYDRAANIRVPSIYEDVQDGRTFTIITAGRFALNVFVGASTSPTVVVPTVATNATGSVGSRVMAVADKSGSKWEFFRVAMTGFVFASG